MLSNSIKLYIFDSLILIINDDHVIIIIFLFYIYWSLYVLFYEDLISIMSLLVCRDVRFPKNCLQMLSSKIFQMQYDLLYNHTSYLRCMIYILEVVDNFWMDIYNA